MNKEKESEDVESAYGSEIFSNSKCIMRKDFYTIEDALLKSPSRYQWLKHKLRKPKVQETVFFLILLYLLITCHRITSQNEETQRMISSLQSQFNSFQKQATGEDIMKKKEQEIEEIFKTEYEKMDEMAEEVLKKVRILSEEVLKDTRMKSEEVLNGAVVLLETSISNIITDSEKTDKASPIVPTVSTSSTPKRYNAASLINGARVDTSLSSSSTLNPFFDFDQSSLVLLDRPEPPANKAWCSYEKNPVLTVYLAEYIYPTAVSYQHSKWNGTIPADAPKEYSVEACLDNYCMNRKPLFSNCEYNGHQEQLCNISNQSIDFPVGKLQFRFQKNHGNTERTCVSLVRVYSEDIQEEKFRSLRDTTTCLDWKNTYQNNPLQYKYKQFKTCKDLYSKGCCEECPECCEECQIKDFDADVIAPILTFCAIFIISPLAAILCIFLFEKIGIISKR